MRQQQTALVLCALLFSTFGHDLLNRHSFIQEKLQHSRSHHAENRLSIPIGCHVECHTPQPSPPPPPTVTTVVPAETTVPSVPGTPGLSVFLNATIGLLAIVNSTAQAAIIFDISSSLAVVLSGSAGGAVVINFATGSGFYITSQVWSASVSFSLYFAGLTSLQAIWSLGVSSGRRIDSNTNDQVVLDFVARILITLSSDAQLLLSASSSKALQYFIELAKRVSEVYGTDIKLFLSLFIEVSVGIRIQVDLLGLLGILEGVFKVVGKIVGGIAALIRAKIQFDLAILATLATGIAVFAQVVTTIVAKLGTAVIATLFATVNGFFEILVLLGGGIVVGVSAIANIIWQLLLAAQNPANLGALIKAIIDFVINTLKAPGAALGNLFNAFLDDLIRFLRSLNIPSISVVVQFLVSLRAGSLVVLGINVYGAISILLNVAGSALEVAIRIILAIAGLFQPILLIPQLFLVLLQHLTSIRGILQLINLIPGINIDIDAVLEGRFDLIGYILSKINIFDILGKDLIYIITHLPIIGAIFSAISGAINLITNGSIQITVIFKAQGGIDILRAIWGFISSLLGFKFQAHIGSRQLEHGTRQHEHRHKKEPHFVDQARYLGEHHREFVPTHVKHLQIASQAKKE